MGLQKLIFIIIVITTFGCEVNNTSNADDDNYNKKFERLVKDFLWKRANNYHNTVDRFLIEKEFNEAIRDSLKDIVVALALFGITVTVLYEKEEKCCLLIAI